MTSATDTTLATGGTALVPAVLPVARLLVIAVAFGLIALAVAAAVTADVAVPQLSPTRWLPWGLTVLG